MKIDARDLRAFELNFEALRDQLSERNDANSDLAIKNLTGGGPDQALEVADSVRALNPLLARIYVWAEVIEVCKEVLAASPVSAMSQVIDGVDILYTGCLECAVAGTKEQPEFYPHVLESFISVLQALRHLQTSVDVTEDICVEIDRKNGWESGFAIERMKEQNSDVYHALRRGIASAISNGTISSEALAKVRTTAATMGIDLDTLDLPTTRRDAELDGGVDNIPRADVFKSHEEVPRSVPRYLDNADGVDRAPLGSIERRSSTQARDKLRELLKKLAPAA